MKRYLGSAITAFAAIVEPLFCVGCLIFGLTALCSQVNVETIFVAILYFSGAFSMGLYMKIGYKQLYSWGRFGENGVEIQMLFSKKKTMLQYRKCRECGIGFYTHGILNSAVGTKVYFIFLSQDVLDETHRTNMNLWKPGEFGIKVAFDKKLYIYLLSVLPKKLQQKLQKDYNKHFVK